MWRIRKLFRGTARLIAWAPIIWSSEEWDWAYLFELIEFKLARMQKAHEQDDVHQHHMRYARQIQVVRTLFKRLREDDYASKDFREHYDRWGDWTFAKLPDGGSLLGPCENEKTPEDSVRKRKEFQRITKLEQELVAQDAELLKRLFFRNYRGWWT